MLSDLSYLAQPHSPRSPSVSWLLFPYTLSWIFTLISNQFQALSLGSNIKSMQQFYFFLLEEFLKIYNQYKSHDQGKVWRFNFQLYSHTNSLSLIYMCVCVCITNSKFKIWEKAFVFNNSLMTTAIVKVMGEGWASWHIEYGRTNSILECQFESPFLCF